MRRLSGRIALHGNALVVSSKGPPSHAIADLEAVGALSARGPRKGEPRSCRRLEPPGVAKVASVWPRTDAALVAAEVSSRARAGEFLTFRSPENRVRVPLSTAKVITVKYNVIL